MRGGGRRGAPSLVLVMKDRESDAASKRTREKAEEKKGRCGLFRPSLSRKGRGGRFHILSMSRFWGGGGGGGIKGEKGKKIKEISLEKREKMKTVYLLCSK